MVSKKNVKIAEVEDFLKNVMDPQDMEVIVIRGKDCEVVYANSLAEVRMGFDMNPERRCNTGFAKSIPGLCSYCQYGDNSGEPCVEQFEVEDKEGHTYSAKCSTINWIDGKQAAIFFLRDITQDKEIKEKLYKLAYFDQLTGAPNRQRLKEDFGALERRIADNMLVGAIALFDLDHFKAVNDTYGHNTGDMVLRRLTEHLLHENDFAERIYRLGGDEFVFLLTNEPHDFASHEEMQKSYEELLSTTLRSYTLPNIEFECTLSMGISFFPKHGISLSEILRKADIALYKAKARGRNQLVFFENLYDIAQKFKDLYINIQPILLVSGKTYGYELIDYGSGGEESESTVSLTEFNRALDALGLKDIENDAHYFISYSRVLMTPTVLVGLPKDKFIVQMPYLENVTQKDLQVYAALRKAGYKLALMGMPSGKTSPEVMKLVNYCKFSPEDVNTAKQKSVIAANPSIRFIATGVDTHEAFKAAKAVGFLMFQGYFFNQPVIVQKTKEIDPLKLNYFRLLKLSSTDDYLDFREISSVISSDVALTYRLLRLLNSAAVGLRNVSSITMAVAYLGEENLRKWIAVLALRGIAEDKPLELVRISLIRARFGELLSPHFRTKREPNQAFMVGLLSLLHIALDKSREQLFEEIHVSEDLQKSLLSKNGIYSDLLSFYENYEYANWDDVSRFAEENHLDAQTVNDAYIESVRWYNDLINT